MSKPGLTAKQEAFARAYVELGCATEAYFRAYAPPNAKRESIHVRASELLAMDKVAARVKEIQAGLEAKMQKRFVVTIERVVEELAKIGFDERDDHRTVVNKLSALDKLGKHLGMFNATVQITGKDGAPLIPESEATPRELARVFLEIIREAQIQEKDGPQ